MSPDPRPIFRPGTTDTAIWAAVRDGNEYGLPDRFDPRDVVVDIGAHTGAFAAACLERGAVYVIAAEPDPENAALFRRNLADHPGRWTLIEAAAWRGDIGPPALPLTRFPGNPAGSQVVWSESPEFGRPAGHVAAMPLDAILASVGGPVRLLKLDCEGAEYPILLTSRRLDLVREVVGEWHKKPGVAAHARVDGRSDYGPDDLASALEAVGFAVAFPGGAAGMLGPFRAARRR